MRVMGIDYGDARVGVAISDPLGITAQGIETLENKVFDKMLDKLADIINQYLPETIVLGMPKNMDGTIGFRGKITLDFAEKLKEIAPKANIVFYDERLTTALAGKVLTATGTYGKKRKKTIDTVAASIILQSYLESLK